MEVNFQLLNLLCGVLGITLFLLFVVSSVISKREKEYPAAKRLLMFSIVILAPFILNGFIFHEFQIIVSVGLIIFSLIISAVFMIPLKGEKIQSYKKSNKKIDERDIMFSRRILEKGTPLYEEYYSRNPEFESLDNEFREKPGLLKPGSSLYNPLMYPSADATFETIDKLKLHVEGPVAADKKIFDKNEIATYIKEWSKHLGALDCGVTLLEEYHKYSHVGRDAKDYGKEVELNHKYAIAFTVEMDYDMVKCAPAGPIVLESSKQYLESGKIAIQVANFIRSLGYPARAHVDGNYRVVCPVVARDAGLGEIGRMGLLMTPKQGPRVRVSVVTTDLPLSVDESQTDETIIDFCERCMKCADTCPSNAISLEPRKEINGSLRWQINSEACFTFWCTVGTDCGRCMAVCPYSHPDNLMHNFVRWGIKNNSNFRKAAVKLDDFLYGRKPEPAELEDWMKFSEKE